MGVVSIKDALEFARNSGLDLIEVAPDANPPVCKILDYGKFLYKQQIKEKESKKKQHVVKLKEVRFRPGIGESDLKVKVENIKKFVKDGAKVKVTVMFRGRELAHTERGFELIDKMIEEVSDIADIDKKPAMEGRNIITFFVAK